MACFFFTLAGSPGRSSHLSTYYVATDHAGGGRDHPFTVLEDPFGIATEKVELMLAAFLAHRLDVLDRMRARDLCEKFGEEVHFASRPLQHLLTEEHAFLEHQFLRLHHEFQSVLVQFGGFRFRIDGRLRGTGSNLFRQICHDNLRFPALISKFLPRLSANPRPDIEVYQTTL